MNKVLILNSSPRKGGNCMQVSKTIQELLPSAPVLSLYDYEIQPCIDCGYCAKNIGLCSLDSSDTYSILLEKCLSYKKTIIVTPIYFYHAPAQLKAFIDRSQRFWNKERKINKNLHAIYIAARTKGEKLSQGLELSLKYFAPMIDAELKESICLYGLESQNDFLSSKDSQEKVSHFISEICL